MVLAPAHAESRSFEDAVDNGSKTANIVKVKVTNTKKYVQVRVKYLKYSDESYAMGDRYQLGFDINPKRQGPEVGVFGINEYVRGGKFKKWKPKVSKKWNYGFLIESSKCGKTMRFESDWSKGVDRLRIRKKKGCLGHPKVVRVYVRVIDSDAGVPDYFPKRKDLSPKVRVS